VSYEAVNPPYTYLPSGIAMRLAGGRDVAARYRLGRAAMSVICVILLGLSILLLWDRDAGALSLTGLMAATTPLSVWSFAVLNPSGLEMAGATCWAAALLRLVRRPAPPAWVWGAAALGGVVLLLARSSGPLLLVAITACVGLLFGLGELRQAPRRSGRSLAIVAGCLAIALAAALYWSRYLPSYPLGLDVLDHVGDAVTGLPETFRSAVGRFPGDYFVPAWLAAAWAVLVATLVVAAGAAAPAGERRRLAVVAAVVVAFVVAYAALYLNNGSRPFNGRYALPVFVVLPLCAGALLVDSRARLADRTRALVVVLTFATAGLQLLAWWLAARRLAVGTDGRFFFFTDPAWHPPGGWLPWLLVMLAGTAAYCWASAGAASRPARG
jgi:hypothetical protein